MLEKKDCFLLGYITKTSGLKGGLQLFLDVDQPERYRNLESIFLELQGEFVPFFVRDISIKGNAKTAVLYLEDIDNTDQAESLCGSDVYLPLELLPSLSGKQFYYHEVEGFEVIDQERGSVGVLKMVVASTAQPIFQVMNGKTEILIPAVDDIILKIDRKEKCIHIQAPDGLLDLYISETDGE